jgi:hypothetical protein
MMRITRSIKESIRPTATWEERWSRPDDGLIACWERGREMAQSDKDLAQRAKEGHLVILPWRGGVEKALKSSTKKYGTLYYLAMWQGLRDEDLNVDLAQEVTLTCAATGMKVIYTSDRAKYVEP